MIDHILSEFITCNLPKIIHIDHLFRDKYLLVNSCNHVPLIHGLVVSAYKIPVKIHIQIVYLPDMRQRIIDIDIVHVECMLRKLKLA